MKYLIVDDERIARSELKFCIKAIDDQCAVFEAENVESAMEIVDHSDLDGIFLDVQLAESSGLDLAQKIHQSKPDLPIVFATAYDKYAIDAFAVSAIDYVLKPFREEDVQRALIRFKRIKHKISVPSCPADKISVWMGEKALVISVSDISYITTLDRQTVLVTRKGKLTTNQSLDVLEQRLCSCGFMRVQRAFIVNLNTVSEIIPWFNNSYVIKLCDNTEDVIPVSRQKINQLREVFNF